MTDKSSPYQFTPRTTLSSVSEDEDQCDSKNDVEANIQTSNSNPENDNSNNNNNHNNTSSASLSKNKNKLNYINSGPMSEGHIRMYSSSPSRLSDFSQNICLFNKCLLLVGVTTIAIGINMRLFHQSMIVAIVLIAFGSFSVGSAIVYTLVYTCNIGLTKVRGRKTESASGPTKSNNSLDEQRTKLNSMSNGNFSHFVEYSDGTVQIGNLHNASDDGDSIDGQQQDNSYCDNSLLLNVDNLDYGIMSTQNLDSKKWSTTTNSEIPQNYLNSFGEVPKIFGASISLIDQVEDGQFELDQNVNKQIGPFEKGCEGGNNCNNNEEEKNEDHDNNSDNNHQLDEFNSIEDNKNNFFYCH